MAVRWTPRVARFGRRRIREERGQRVASVRWLAARWQWSLCRVQHFMEDLRRDGSIRTEVVSGITLVTIRNYDEYNPPPEPVLGEPLFEPPKKTVRAGIRSGIRAESAKDTRPQGPERAPEAEAIRQPGRDAIRAEYKLEERKNLREKERAPRGLPTPFAAQPEQPASGKSLSLSLSELTATEERLRRSLGWGTTNLQHVRSAAEALHTFDAGEVEAFLDAADLAGCKAWDVPERFRRWRAGKARSLPVVRAVPPPTEAERAEMLRALEEGKKNLPWHRKEAACTAPS